VSGCAELQTPAQTRWRAASGCAGLRFARAPLVMPLGAAVHQERAMHQRGASAGIGLSILLWIAACGQSADPAPSPDDGVVSGAGGEGPAAGMSGTAGATPGISGSGAGGMSGGGAGASGKGQEDLPNDPGTAVTLSLNASDQAALAALEAQLDPLESLDATTLLQQRPIKFAPTLGYDPQTAKNLDLIQASPAALDAAELAKLKSQGFAISTRQQYPNMIYGYKTIYSMDLPVYVSLDSILDALHQSYDDVLKAVEYDQLIPNLITLLSEARNRLTAGAVTDAKTAKDLDFYLAVAYALVQDRSVAPVAGADKTRIDDFVMRAKAANGIQEIELFGVKRDVDFSQFTPRGHYTDDATLKAYFRAMIWLGRVEFRLTETKENGALFHRRQLEAALALRSVVQGEAAAAYANIDAVVSEFVGEHDYMQLAELDQLLADLGGSMSALTDAQIAQVIIDKGYGAQRIASQVVFKDAVNGPTLPLDRSFALLGQRYIIDSHVFSNVVFDRVVPKAGDPVRSLPDPLDVAYAALGNSAALPLLESGLKTYKYAPQLERMRRLVDAHGDDYWQNNLYNSWLGTLRSISPAADGGPAILPAVAKTEAWSKRMLNTQLASWAELRHDTILYAKQSYSTGGTCEFPDAYVDPYPEAFARIAKYAKRGQVLSDLLAVRSSSQLVARVREYFTELDSVATMLHDMADQQQKGVPFTAAQMTFINDAVRSTIVGCGGPPSYTGWYARLLFNSSEAMDPTIADVHTDPGGDHSPQVLHVATGLPRLMVVTIDTCNGPRAYAGVAFAYHEVVTQGLKRLTDVEWAQMTNSTPDVPWMESVLR
jgi:hypothetical protein